MASYHPPGNPAAVPPPGVQSYYTPSNFCDFYHFWSNHPGGAQFAFADGSVHFLPQTINYTTYQYLGCRHDGQVASLP